jgi:hypothetical protein
MRLHPASLPALFLVLCESEELDDWKYVSIATDHRWVPIENRHWLLSGLWDPLAYGRNFTKRATNVERLGLANRLGDLLRIVNELASADPAFRTTPAMLEVRARTHALESAVASRTLTSKLPTTQVGIAGVDPDKLDGTKALGGVELAVSGQRMLRGAPERSVRVFLGGLELEVKRATENAVRVAIPAARAGELHPGKYPLLVVSGSRVASLPNAVTVQGAPKAKSALTIAEVHPATGSWDRETVFVVVGEGFGESDAKRHVTRVLVGGRECEFTVANDKALIVTVKAWTEAGKENHSLALLEAGVPLVVVSDTDGGAQKQVKFSRMSVEPSVDSAPRVEGQFKDGKLVAVTLRNLGSPPSEGFLKALRYTLEVLRQSGAEVRLVQDGK